MINNINNNDIDITIWLNGKKKEFSFQYHISDIISTTLRPLKEKISKYITQNNPKKILNRIEQKNWEIIHIYSIKEIELQDYDIPYLKNGDILFITFDNSPFNPSNHYYQYELIKWIKEGGYGKVFLGRHVLTQREYAIKQINVKHFSSEDMYNISREHVILQSLNHKNIIKCYHSFAYDDHFFTIMDNAKGGELSSLLKEKGRLSEKEAKNIFEQIYQAVNYIHGKNIIHRDLKPNNILFLDEEKTQVVLIDFGISGFSNGNSKEIVQAGTTRYLPPEMASGKTFLSNPKLDVWALGIILYQMVQGQFPFEGKNENEVVQSIIKSPLRFRKRIKISSSCKELIEGMLEKNAKFRIGMDSELFDNWFDANTECAIRSVHSMKQSIPYSKAFDNEFFFEEKNSSGLNAYQSPIRSNIRQHISDYLNSVEQVTLKKRIKHQNSKKITFYNPLKKSSDIELPVLRKNTSKVKYSSKLLNNLNNKGRKVINFQLSLRNSSTNSSVNLPTPLNPISNSNSNLKLHTPQDRTNIINLIRKGESVRSSRMSYPIRYSCKNSILSLNKGEYNNKSKNLTTQSTINK